MASKKLFLDVETQKSFRDVGGRRNMNDLKVSVAGAYADWLDEYLTFEEDQLSGLERIIKEADQIIGFNILGFDYLVLQPYFETQLSALDTFDILQHVERFLGYRLSLNHLAKHTLGKEKSGHGLEAIELYARGEMNKLKNYVLDDVRLTYELYKYGIDSGYLAYQPRGVFRTFSIPALWSRSKDHDEIVEVFEQSLKQEKPLEMLYVSGSRQADEDFTKRRQITVKAIDGDKAIAFCHLRNDDRHFRFYRVLDARLVS
ncbi:MAG: DEAD/DEAH box helicase [Parcubacteria group bacterium GW2011_GWA2_47_8]|nr:MAG: DEAD/DEAH box helicase [Parcubacteria group bacterium GW2011_GWA2_47_8]